MEALAANPLPEDIQMANAEALHSRTSASILEGKPVLPFPPTPTAPLAVVAEARSDGQILMATDDPEVSIFDILNTFHQQWFLNQDHLISLIMSKV